MSNIKAALIGAIAASATLIGFQTITAETPFESALNACDDYIELFEDSSLTDITPIDVLKMSLTEKEQVLLFHEMAADCYGLEVEAVEQKLTEMGFNNL